ncbi:MAG: hypothetical protein KAJ19_16480 [Gammaproteobacteria bacterium]|nr:hypothetical protein [Gammaproteobacteria bacterium]
MARCDCGAPEFNDTEQCESCFYGDLEAAYDSLRSTVEYFTNRDNWYVEIGTGWMRLLRPRPYKQGESAYIDPWEFLGKKEE